MWRLDGRVAIVTGASSGLGAHIARYLVGSGATVVAAARRTDLLDDLAEQLGGRLIAVTTDVSDEQSRARLVAVAAEISGSVDILVNNAARLLSPPPRPEDESTLDFTDIIDVNLVSLFALTALVGRGMLARGAGSIVNVASIFGLVGSSIGAGAAYSASKGAVINLTRELGVRWARRGVRVNALAPGWFRSEMTDAVLDDQRGRAWIERRCPMGRAGELEELNGALSFLCSDASTYVTGQVLVVDGGWTAC
jgi:NAD(P)-dependent dehydrogenase (short-subunit alcohol dehydrogenase family)